MTRSFYFNLVAFGSFGVPIQLGLLLHAAVVMTALKLSARLSTCDRAMKAACSAERSAAKYS